MTEPFDFSEYRHATLIGALLEEAQKCVGQPWTASKVPIAPVGERVTLELEGGITLIGRVDVSDIDAKTMSGTIVEAVETPPTSDWDEEKEAAWDAFRAGFSASYEGWNGELPDDDDEQLRGEFEKWFSGDKGAEG